MDRENEVSKIFIMYISEVIRDAGKETTVVEVKQNSRFNCCLFEIVACKTQTVLQIYVT